MSKFLLLMVLTLAPFCAVAETIYRSTDAQGNVRFTDTPPTDGSQAQQIDIQPTNTAPAPQELHVPAKRMVSSNEQQDAKTYSVSITAPANETTIAIGPGNFSVSASIGDELSPSESLQLFMDGSALGEPQEETTWALTNVFRGQHDLTVAILDPSGSILAVSQAVRVFVLRPSIITRARNKR
ncbi:MAG: DUF4124 domain-containing protein [Halioglobus sp.]|nr:DUF4124 domain-containing protein [Halioglobus sp.]